MKNNHILIVEDEWIIYDELASFFKQKGFDVSPYIKTYDEAISYIQGKLPDIALLDINLQGEKDGIDLGDKFFSTYKIPFIYLSAYSDEVTVNRARRTNPGTFLIKTKPQIDREQLLISVKMTLSQKDPSGFAEREGIFVYTDYYKDLKDESHDTLKKALFRFDDILYIETDTEKRNYIVFHTNGSQGYLKSSLTKAKELLPFHFARVNPSQIINLKKVDGKVNHSLIKVYGGVTFRISSNYSNEVHRILHSFYYD